MATHLTHCSSSFEKNINGGHRVKGSLIVSSRVYCRSSKWVSPIVFKFRLMKRFQVKSSNGYPLDAAVSVHDDFPRGSIKQGEPQVKEMPHRIEDSVKKESTLSITVVGASGDLAKKKIFPALFALFYEDCLPQNFTVFGYARTKMTDEELRNMISTTLTCRIDKREKCDDKMNQFLERCFYQSGQYNSEEDFAELDRKLKDKEDGRLPNRLFYLSVPPNVFVDVARCASIGASAKDGWTRVIVEKPFGHGSKSSRELTRCLKQYLNEDQIFR